MLRGVFAIGWFFLLASTLISLVSMKNLLISDEVEVQSILMDAEETFYIARNFEFDFKKRVVENNFEGFLQYWGTRGKVNYGFFSDVFEKQCVQTDSTFEDFLNEVLLRRQDYTLFSPINQMKTCVTLEIDYKNFKTYGAIISLTCISNSSPLLSC